MLVYFIIRLSTLSLGLTYVVCTTPQQQSQLAALHERMNQMISALYSSPLLSKVKAATSADEAPTSSQESTYSFPASPSPQVVYVSPPNYLENGAQPNEYAYPLTANPVPRTTYSFDYSSYQPKFTPPVYSPPPTLSRPPYPEYALPVYPQLPAPQPMSLPPPFAPTSPYGSPFSAYPSPAPFGLPMCSGYPAAPGLPSPYPPQVPYPPISFQAPMAPPAYPPALPYPAPPVPSPYQSLPQQFAPSYPSPVPLPYSRVSVPYMPSFQFPQPMYPPTAFPKPSDILPQPQYEYSS